MNGIRKNLLMSDDEAKMLKELADKLNCSEAEVIRQALANYKDRIYLEQEATFLTEDIKRTCVASNEMLERRINRRTNKLLSELAIQQAILAQIMSHDLGISPRQIEEYRKNAVTIMQEDNRVFRLEDGMETT